jgi:hypothetical protein
MRAPRSRTGVLGILVGTAAGIGLARLFAPREGATVEDFGPLTGRGAPEGMPSPAALTAGYEPSDAVASDIAWIMAVFVGSALAAIALMVVLLHVWHGGDARRDAGLTAVQRITIATPEPHLQADPLGEIAGLQRREAALLHGTARLTATTARIPIERAMALMVGQPLDRIDTQGNGRPEPGR